MGFVNSVKNFVAYPAGRAMFWGNYEPKNFGDWVGPYLYNKVTGSDPYHSWTNWYIKQDVLFTAGSILRNIGYSNRAIVWGSGIISEKDSFAKPKRTLLVRGPRTQKRYEELGFECPHCFGDPALILPFFYQPVVDVKYQLGIVPHYTSYHLAIEKFSGLDGVKVIDVTLPIENVMDEIASCEAVLSSSLHGVIVAHALGKKAAWVRFGKELMGDDVKFYDYSESVGHDFFDPGVSLNGADDFKQLKNIAFRESVPPVLTAQQTISRTCPFGEINIP